MNRDLGISLVSDRQASINRLRRRPPVLVELQATGPGLDLLEQCLPVARVTLSEKTEIHRLALDRTHHHFHIEGPRCAGGRVRAGRRTRASP